MRSKSDITLLFLHSIFKFWLHLYWVAVISNYNYLARQILGMTRSDMRSVISLIPLITKDRSNGLANTTGIPSQLRAKGNIGLKSEIKYFYHKLDPRKLTNITSSNCREKCHYHWPHLPELTTALCPTGRLELFLTLLWWIH